MATVIIIGIGDGRRAMRRFELAQEQGLLCTQDVTDINDRIADLNKRADQMGCPPSDTEDGSVPA